MMATILHTVMCQVRSFHLPDVIDTPTEITPAMRYGGQINASVTVCEYPSVWTTLGKKFLKPLALTALQRSSEGSRGIGRPTVQVLDEAEQPNSRVCERLFHARPYRSRLLSVHFITVESRVSQLAFLFVEPSRIEGTIREEGETEDCEEACKSSFWL